MNEYFENKRMKNLKFEIYYYWFNWIWKIPNKYTFIFEFIKKKSFSIIFTSKEREKKFIIFQN
jgi:hypothetical protein